MTSDEAAPPIEDAEPVQTLSALDEDLAAPSTISRAVGELPRSAVILIITAAAVITGAGIKAANGILAPIMMAVVLTILASPVMDWARRHRWPSWAAVALGMLVVYTIVIVMVVGVAVCIVKLAVTLPQYSGRSGELVGELQDKLKQLGLNNSATGDATSQLDLSKFTSLLTSLLKSILDVLGSLFFLITVLFFMVAEASGVRRRAAGIASGKPALITSLDTFVYGTRQYLLVSAIFGGIVAVLDTIGLMIIGVPLPVLWGFLAFITNFIPNVGFVIGVIPPALLGLLDGGWVTMVEVLLLYCVLNVVIQVLIQPHYVGDAVGLSTTVTFLSLTVWTFLLGGLGALLAVPMTLLVRAIFVEADRDARWALFILGPTPPP